MALATLWSLQYIFLRVAVPVFGTPIAAEGRALFAALFLLPWVTWAARQQVGLAVPVLGVLWGWLLLGEAVTLTMLTGMALVLAALALVLRR